MNGEAPREMAQTWQEGRKKTPNPPTLPPQSTLLSFNNSLSYYEAKAHRIMVFSNIVMDVSQSSRELFVFLLCADLALDLGFVPHCAIKDKHSLPPISKYMCT